MAPADPVNVNEFQAMAKQLLPKMYFDFFSGGADDQHTLKQNVQAFTRITLVCLHYSSTFQGCCGYINICFFNCTCYILLCLQNSPKSSCRREQNRHVIHHFGLQYFSSHIDCSNCYASVGTPSRSNSFFKIYHVCIVHFSFHFCLYIYVFTRRGSHR